MKHNDHTLPPDNQSRWYNTKLNAKTVKKMIADTWEKDTIVTTRDKHSDLRSRIIDK